MTYQAIIYLLGVALLLCACDDQLELNPFQSLDEETALSTDATVKAVLVGAYDELGNPDIFGGNNQRDAELFAATTELGWRGTFNAPGEIFDKNLSAGNVDAEETWLESYETINIANNVLSALDVVNASDRDRVEGEAKFIRALVYFDLVRFYGLPYENGKTNDQLGVPLVLSPTRDINAETNVARSTVEEIYAQIIMDLEDAIAKLPAENGFFATTYAASALRARVYLQMQRYAEARTDANRVIEEGPYALTSDYAAAFSSENNTSEDVFALQVTSQDGENSLTTFFSTRDFGGRNGDIFVREPHLDLYEAGDERLDLFYENGGRIYTGKFNDPTGVLNVRLIRLAEMYLIRAEANERLDGENVGASPTDDINTLRNRAGLDNIEGDGVDLDFILKERRRELAFEGFRLHDIKRLQENVGTLAFDAPELLFPIPAREIVANPNLIQNEAYK